MAIDRLVRVAAVLGAPMVVGAVLQGGAAHAGRLELTPSFNQNLSYDDNVALTTDDEIGTWISRSEARLSTDAGSPTTNLQFDAGASLVEYFQENGLNTDNEDAALRLTHVTDRSAFGLNTTYVRDTTISSPLDIDGTLALTNERRQTFTLGPTYSYQLGPTQILQFTGGYTNRSYPNADETSAVNDYSQYAASASWLKDLNLRTQAGVGFNAVYVDANTQQVSVGSLVGILNWQISPRLAFNISAGPGLTRSDTSQVTGLGGTVSESEDTIGYYFDSGLDWTITRRSGARLAFKRSVEPYGTGQSAVTRNSLTLSGDHNLSRYLTFTVNGTYQIDQAVGNDNTSVASQGDITTIIAQPTLRWSVTEDIDLSLSYRLRYRSFEVSDLDAVSQAVIFRVGIDLPELRRNW